MPSDRKHGPSKPKKRKFVGNQYTNKPKTSGNSGESSGHVNISLTSPVLSSTSGSIDDTATPTRSEQKLQDMYKLMFDCTDDSDSDGTESDSSDGDNDGEEEKDYVEENVLLEKPQGNRIIDVEILCDNIASNLVCRHCRKNVTLVEVVRKGLASTFAFQCSNCDRQPSFSSSPQIPVGNGAVNIVNRRAAFAMRCIGGDRSELETFCGVMDLPRPAGESSYKCINKTLHKASTSVQKVSMQTAAAAEYEQAEQNAGDENRNIDISSDGTWMTRGHSSKIGVVTTIGMKNGKVLDTQAESKVCKSCDYWRKKRSEH
jgi:hypothetical protein